jgi:two-component system response regulator HydG
MREAPIRVYVVDDEPLIHGVWRRILARQRFDVVSFQSARAALAALAGDPAVDVLVTDLAMPEMDGMELLRRVKAERPEIEVVMVTAHAGLETAIAAVKAGAYHFIAKPFDAEAPALLVKQAAERKRLIGHARTLEHELRTRDAAGSAALVGPSPEMRRLRELIAAAGPTTASVLVLGESGTGKELVAQAIHAASPRRDKAFLAINCSALADSLLESELFGFVKGAFTGADQARAGLFEAADGGTILLDEIGHAPAPVQMKLLRVLQEGEVRPVGAQKNVRVDVRVIAATNVDLQAAVRDGKFREDLYYRLNVLAIRVPPLRERRDDIAPLAYHFLTRTAAKHGREMREIDPDALAALLSWHWPGNVRELENAIERAVVLGRGHVVGVADLPDAITVGTRRGTTGGAPLSYTDAKAQAQDAFDRAFVEGLLARTGGNISEAARLAGLDRSNFKRLMRKFKP